MMMANCDNAPHDKVNRVKTIYHVGRVWNYFMKELASPENAMPNELKAQLISIGIFILKHLDKMRDEPTANFQPLREITATLQKGLS